MAVIGILAHVDSGKTTLSEAVLYKCGVIRKRGRVDHKDSFLDTNSIERDRGITVFSKQAIFSHASREFTLLDTPGHVDFSGETERALQVMDAAVLVVSGSEGVQSHTVTLSRMLEKYGVPTIIFVNKMDMQGADKGFAMRSITAELGENCIDMTQLRDELEEALSTCCEELMNRYLENGKISDDDIAEAVDERELIPCYFGSALNLKGVDELLDGLARYTKIPEQRDDFGARVYKVTEDNGARLAHMKITGGTLSVRDAVTYTDKNGEQLTEKISRIRIYNGEKFTSVETAVQGQVCAVMGLSGVFSGQGLGFEPTDTQTILEPVLTYRVMPPEGVDDHTMLKYLQKLEEEDPKLNVAYNEQLGEICVSLMGEVQAEVLKRLISERFGCDIDFSEGRISYRETIAEPVLGAGHFEPLRHYAEVHLRLEPLPRGSGLRFSSDCSEDILAKNWQRLILTHLREKVHKGVLTCSPITDMHITLVAGRAHLKHTEGGDFRQATYRAVRQGLMCAKSVLLEPYYSFRLELPAANVGRALNDLEIMSAAFEMPQTMGESSLITGTAPVSAMRNYHTAVAGYTKGQGRLTTEFSGYDVCKNADEVISKIAYDPEADRKNTADSVFCSHGAGHIVPWNEAAEKMHVSPDTGRRQYEAAQEIRGRVNDFVRRAADDDELMAIFERTYGKINREKRSKMRTPKEASRSKPKKYPTYSGTEYLLVDGYNIIFSWDELKKLAASSIDSARGELITRLSNYQGYKQCELIIVFDAYKVNEPERVIKAHNISVVYTKSAETADTYIERTAHALSKENKVRVATSDGTEQMIIFGSGAFRVTASELHHEVETAENAIREYIEQLNRQKL